MGETIMWVGRRLDNTVYGIWAREQPKDEFHTGIEELPDDHPDIVAFRNRPRPVAIDPRDIKIAELEARITTVEGKTL